MEVVRGPIRVPAGTKPVVVVIRPNALETVPDGLERPARFDEPPAQPPAGFAHRFGEIRGFGLWEVRGEPPCGDGKRVAPLDRCLEFRAVARVPVEGTPHGVGFAQRLGGGMPGERARSIQRGLATVLRLASVEFGFNATR